MATKTLTPKEIEAQKTAEERAEDTAYVINHALSCGATDTFIQPFAGAFVQDRVENGKWPKWLSWMKHIFESHDHHGGHDHESHDDHDHASHDDHDHENHGHKTGFLANTKHWLLGEAAGDFLAVPLTVLVQRHFPGFTSALRKGLEPIAGWYFRKGAERDAKRWALRGNHTAEETKAKENQLYNNELRHLPLAVVWNMFSIPINIITQVLTGSKAAISTMLLGKTFGTVISNFGLIGGRAVAPATFEKWDKFNSDHFIRPVAREVGKVFGVDEKTSKKATEAEMREHLRKHPEEAKNWADRSQRAEQPISRQ